MMLQVHHLLGCSPMPLALYLKAIGILRLVAQQKDPDARAWWENEYFCLLTKLDREELERFFLEEYSPTPVFNPWGGRSGFFDGSNEKNSRAALISVEQSTLPRLVEFQRSIAEIRIILNQYGNKKPNTSDERLDVVRSIRRQLRGPGMEWLGAVLADLGDDSFGPPIFGTGGNEGSGSYTAAFFAAVRECIVQRSWDNALRDALFLTGVSATQAWDGSFFVSNPKNPARPKKENVQAPFRQFLPEGDLSPWDLILMFEGGCAMRSGVSRRNSGFSNDRLLGSPFYFAPHGVGGFTSCDSDEFVINQGRRQPGRGEQWFPLWEAPTSYAELQTLISEGRCSVGRMSARKPLDGARAISRLGVTRGVTEFVRYGYLQRNNLATHFAVPLGRVRVRYRRAATLIEDISSWMQRLQRLARESHAPARLVQTERRLADAVFAVLTHDDSPQRWQAVLQAAVAVESLQAGGTALKAGPIPVLQQGWVDAIHDNSAEVRLALALGSSAAAFTKNGRPIDPIRHHWLPLKPGARHYNTSEGRPARDSRVVAFGRDPVTDLTAVVGRRLLEAESGSQRVLPLRSAYGCEATLGDLAALIEGHVDLSRVLTLARALMALNWNKWNAEQVPRPTRSSDHPDEAWLALRLACLPWPIAEGLSVPAEPSLLNRLMSGDGSSAVRIAAARLGACGIRIPFRSALTDVQTAQLWAAALAFPISRYSARCAVEILVPNFFGVSHA